MSGHPEILAYGEPMLEFNQTGGAASRDYLQGFGGDTSNFIIAAARQGASAGFVGAVGDDEYGRAFRALWQAEGVEARHVRSDASAPTGVYFVSHDAGGHSFSFLRKGSASSRYAPADLPIGAITAARLLHLSGISLAISDTACDAGFEAMALAKSAGVTVTFDTNLRLRLWPQHRARAIITEALRMCDVALPSLDDLLALGWTGDAEAMVERILGLGPRIVVLKRGAAGCIVATGGMQVSLPPHPCTPVDATGAGDCFGGSFAARLVAGDDAVAAARYANVAAALSTQGYGAVDPIPRADIVRDALSTA